MMPSRTHSLGRSSEHAASRDRAMIDTAILAGALVLFTLLALQMMPFVPDDSFISYRYAANLAGGHGLRFNPTDSPVEGYSNFLWIALLAGAVRLGLDPVTTGAFLGGLLGLLSIVALWAILKKCGRTGVHLAVPVGLAALAAPLLLYAISGMETALFAFLLLAGLWVAANLLARPTVGRGLMLAAAGVLAALTRPEGVLALPVIAVCLVVAEWQISPARRKEVGRAVGVALLAFVVMLAAYHLWRVAYFGAVWPTPFLSKGAAGGASSFIKPLRTNLGQFFVRQTHYYAPMGYYYAAIMLGAILGALLARRRRHHRPVEWAALILALVYAAVYLNFVDWMPGMRYYAPLLGLLLIPFSLLGPELRNDGEHGDDWRSDLAFLFLGAALGIFSLSSLAALRLESRQLQASTQVSMVELGHWLRETMPPDAVLAMSDVGATPYYSGLRTIDINPDSLTDRTIAENGWSADYFFATNPDVVAITAFSLTHPDFYGAHEALYALPRFQSTYQRIGVVRNDWYQDRSYWVFVRRDISLTPEQLATFPRGIYKP